MSGRSQNGGVVPTGMLIPLPAGFEVSWAGPLPTGRIFCLGSEDGKLLFTKDSGEVVYGPAKASPSGSAINGVALSDIWLAVSTRDEISFTPLLHNEKESPAALAFEHGAHGISTTPSGYFIAPMGRTGIMAAAPPLALGESITVLGDDKGDFYSYRAACLRAADGAEILVVAARQRGLGFAPFRGTDDRYVMTTASLEGLDVVDFCALFPGTTSLAVAALGRDGSLVLFRDILGDRKPATFQFKTVTGTGYRVFSSLGDIYVVTNKGLFMLAKLATHFVNSAAGDTIHTRILTLGMPVVDANLCGDEWMLVVTSDGVQRFDVRALHESGDQDAAAQQAEETPSVNGADNWKWSDVAQNRVQLALAG